MTRSEVVKMLVDEARLNCERFESLGDFDGSEIERSMLNTELDILLAEQKRSEGCLYCNGNMLDGYALENMYGESQRIINLAMNNHRSGDQLPISFCPNCGRDLTDGESV